MTRRARTVATLIGPTLFAVVLATAMPAAAGKRGQGNGPTAFQRAVFSDDVEGSPAGIRGDGSPVGSCGAFDYWTTVDSGDPECGKVGGNVQVGLTGQDGLWFQTHDGSTNLNDPFPGTNRHFTLDFTGQAPCPDLDSDFYGSVPGEVVGYVPVPDPDPCVDNVEGRLRVGTGIFDLPAGVAAEPAMLEVVVPLLNTKGKKSAIEWQPTVATLTFVSPLIVTDSGIGDDDVTLTCSDFCIVSVRRQGVELGEFNLPIRLRVKRVICDSSGCTP